MKENAMDGLSVCPVCGDEDFRVLYRFQPARWIPGKVVRCSDCTMIYKIPSSGSKPLVDYYDQTFTGLDYFHQEEAAVRALQKVRDHIANTLDATSLSLLDIGCGTGIFLKLAQQAGFDVTGLELNSTLANKVREKTKAEVIVGDFMSAGLDGRLFDVITLLDLIEHLPNPLSALKRCHKLLKPGGYIVVYTPNHSSLIVRFADVLYRISAGRVANPITEIFDLTHVTFFDLQTLSLALTKTDFSVVKTILLKYDPSRSNLATGISAVTLKVIEAISPLFNGQFRILMFARKAAET